MRIFHIATAEDWAAARAAGRYTTATRGRTLAEEGFIHASRADQWQQARRRWYAEATEPLVLLVVETDLLTARVIEEPAPGGETFPHVYGPIDLAAVVDVVPLDPAEPDAATPASAPSGVAHPGGSFSRVYLREMSRQLLLAGAVMVTVVTGSLLGLAASPGWGPLVGALLGLAAGLVVTRSLERRRRSSALPR